MGKKVGYFALSLLTFIAAFAVMLVVQMAVLMPGTIMASMDATSQGITDYDAIMEFTNNAMMKYMPLAIFLAHVALIVCFSLWYRFGCGKPSLKKTNLKYIFSGKNLVGIILISVGMGYFINFGLSLLYPIIPESIMKSFQDAMESAQFGEAPLAIIAAVLLAPIGEELIFRGVCFYYAKKAVADMKNRVAAFWIANVVQALFFGILHMNVLQATYAFFLGLILGYVAYRFKSVVPAMLVHMIYNGLPTFTLDFIVEAIPESNAVYGVIVGVSFIVMTIGIFMTMKKQETTEEIPAEA